MIQIRDLLIGPKEPDIKNVGWVSFDKNTQKYELKFYINGRWLPIVSNIDTIEPEKIEEIKELIEWINNNGTDFNNSKVSSIIWNNYNDPSNMNDFVVAGMYNIKGEHTRINDNLPILNTGGGHTFNARLTVLDSSITGSGENDDKCITQILSFDNRLGQGEVYIRTGKGRTHNSLTWEPWSTLQRNVNVGQVDTLDNLIDNGIYSGVWTKGSYNSYPLTFVCVVINDYFIGITPRRVSQFVYGLSKFDGSVIYQSRIWDDSKDKWGDWEILNKNEITSMISEEIKKITDGIDPEKIDSIKDIVAWIDAHGGDVTAIYKAINENRNNININKDNIANNSIAIGNEEYRATKAEKTLQKNIDNTNNIVGTEEKGKLTVYIGAVMKDGSTYSTNNSAYTNAFEGGDIAVTNEGYFIYDVRKVSADGVAEMVIVKSRRLRTEKGYTYQLNISKDGNGAFSNDEHKGIVGLYNYDSSEIEKNKKDIQYLFEEAVKSDSFEVEELGDGIGINYDTFDGNSGSIEIPFATKEKAGVMSAEDKKALDDVNSVINIGEYQNIQAVWDACKQVALNNPEISIIKYSIKAGVTYNSGVVFQSYHYNDSIITQYYLYGGGQKHECNVRHIVSDGTTDNWQPIQMFTSYKFENGTLYGYKYGKSESEQNKVPIVDIPNNGSAIAELMQEVTYSELVTLRDTNKLVAGTKYRITDYVTTTVQKDTKSANHPFDVIVEAVSENELSELAQAIQHEGDTYFEGNDLGAWQLWYDLDNNTKKYAWADAENGKGVIYRMIDEKRNDCPYDFKNILFYTKKYTSNTTSDNYYYTFSYVVKGVLYDGTVEKRATGCYNNSMRVYIVNSKSVLNGNIFRNTVFGDSCHSNTFGHYCNSNTFGSRCHSNTFGYGCNSNTFGNYCYSNTFGNYCYSNTFGNYCYSNTFGNDCNSNTFGNECFSNKFGDSCFSNKFGYGCHYNTFGYGTLNRKLDSSNTSITLNEEYYDNGTNALVPIKHPDLSTQPSILPYKFMGQYVYEQLIPNIKGGNFSDDIQNIFAVKKPLIISADSIGGKKSIDAMPKWDIIENTFAIQTADISESENVEFFRIVYTSMPEEGGYYGYNNY